MNIAQHVVQQKTPFYSLEFFPPKDRAQWPEFLETVQRLKALQPLFASVTYGAGGSTQRGTLEIAEHIVRLGMDTLVHLTCIGASRDTISAFLHRLPDIGVNTILALRGDPPRGRELPQGEFTHASDLVGFIRQQCPDMGIAVAGYPAPHPESPSFSADRTLTAKKIQAGADMVITQLFFDVREYFDLVEQLRSAGVTVPVIPGILPIQSFDSVRRILSMCGAHIPGQLYLELERADQEGGAAAVREAGLHFAVRQIRTLLDGGAPGIHLYTLNRADLCLHIAKEVGLL